MTFLDLEVPAIKKYEEKVSPSSGPHWNLSSLISVLNSIEDDLTATSPYKSELKLGSFTSPPCPDPHVEPEETENITIVGSQKDVKAPRSRPFVMRVPSGDGEDDEDEFEDDGDRELSLELVAVGSRFSCADLFLSESESSDDESEPDATHAYLMRKTSPEEGILNNLDRRNQLKLKGDVRKTVSRIEAESRDVYEKTASVAQQFVKHIKDWEEMDRRLERQYQLSISEELNYHLSIAQKNHEKRSQEEELRIKNDAALEAAKRKEKALQEEKARQAKAKAEAEERSEAARKAEEECQKALEAEKIAKQAAEKMAKEAAEKEATSTANIVKGQENIVKEQNVGRPVNGSESTESRGIKVKAADSAIKAEANRLQKYMILTHQNNQLSANIQKEHETCDRQINKRIRQITGTVENVRAKAHELVGIINDPRYPRSISIMLFAKKVVSLCENPSGSFEGTAFACGHVILLVASQLPEVMDFILAEFHKVCIYTVPKHLQVLEASARTIDYWKMLGYRDENGKIESSEHYLQRMEAYMKLYAALVQTESPLVENPHGLKEGWAWLARFLNELPITASTATALHAFLKMAGFSLLRKYGTQFKKILNVISESFLPALKAQQNQNQNQNLASIISKLDLYISKQEYMKEPDGWRLRSHLSSREFV